jgi:lipopolysaccharide transport system ATP-binding protein
MSDTVISVENVSKAYRLGQIGGGTLKEDVSRWWAKLRGKPDPTLKIGQEHHARLMGQEFWALQDVSFEVKEGEVLGIIGRNGAGKSTLLKILSQVTTPTSGEIKVRGRIASLLEVGTGFHPELTGRENIFLNGAILGMTKAEIRKKFDEIVAFSGVEEFIDTPVKRYSSGMYVRLAFAVAAHLEPEILIVDEVLAVGDAEFQKKCIGKMKAVAGHGRTILFVSHNMAAVSNLCTKAILMERGCITSQGHVSEVLKIYASSSKSKEYSNLLEHPERSGEGRARFTKLWIEDKNHNIVDRVSSGDEVVIAVEYKSRDNKTLKNVRASFCLIDSVGQILFLASTELTSPGIHNFPPEGVIRCVFPRFPLTGSEYQISPYLEVNGTTQDSIEGAGTILVEDGDFYGSGKLYPPGWQGKGVLVEHQWILPKAQLL